VVKAPPELVELLSKIVEASKGAREPHYIAINIMGLMDTGKTNISRCLGLLLKDLADKAGLPFYYAYFDDDHLDNLEGVIDVFSKGDWNPRPALYIVLDDLTYSEASINYDKLTHMFLTLRHKLPVSLVAVASVFHWVGSVRPIFRLANIRIVTHISSYYEVEALKKYYQVSYLTEYLKLKEERWDKYDALVNAYGRHIIWLNIPYCSQLPNNIDRYPHPYYRQCLEEAQHDKRIRDPIAYCRERYPPVFKLV